MSLRQKKTVIPSINPSKVVAAQLPPIKIDLFSVYHHTPPTKKKLRNGSGWPSEKLMEDFTKPGYLSREVSPLYLWKG